MGVGLDPVDGTFNYAAGSPMAAILLGLLQDGKLVAGLTWLPFMNERYTAVEGGPVLKNGVPNHRWPRRISTRRSSVSRPSTRTPAAGFPAGTGWRCSKSSAGCRRGCGCTAPPASMSALCRRRGVRRLHQFRRPRVGSRRGVALVRAAGGIVTTLAGDE